MLPFPLFYHVSLYPTIQDDPYLVGLKSHALLRHLCSALYIDFFNEEKVLLCRYFGVKGKSSSHMWCKVNWLKEALWQMFYLGHFLTAGASDRMGRCFHMSVTDDQISQTLLR